MCFKMYDFSCYLYAQNAWNDFLNVTLVNEKYVTKFSIAEKGK